MRIEFAVMAQGRHANTKTVCKFALLGLFFGFLFPAIPTFCEKKQIRHKNNLDEQIQNMAGINKQLWLLWNP